MKTSEKVLFVIGAILTLAAVLVACLAAYFGISALIAVHITGVEGTESIGVAFAMLFMIIFSVVAIGTALVAAIFLLIRPARSTSPPVHRASHVWLWLLLLVN